MSEVYACDEVKGLLHNVIVSVMVGISGRLYGLVQDDTLHCIYLALIVASLVSSVSRRLWGFKSL